MVSPLTASDGHERLTRSAVDAYGSLSAGQIRDGKARAWGVWRYA